MSAHAALTRAITRWGSAGIIAGKGPGRHPFVTRPSAMAGVASVYCGRCGQERNQMIHRAPLRRKCAAFGIFATLRAIGKPENPTK